MFSLLENVRFSTLANYRFSLLENVRFSGFLRTDELLSVKKKDIQIKETHSAITVAKLKTDQPRVEHLVYIARIVSQRCQAMRLEKTLERLI